MKSILNYTNYRIFLKDYYEEEKKKKSFFSYQYLADHCGFKSKSYLYKVIRGEKALALTGAEKIGSFLKLKKRELDYFRAIVMFTNAEDYEKREYYFKKLQKLSKKSDLSKLRQNQFEYFNNWYNAVIRELVSIIDWNNDYSILAKSVIPSITEKEAKDSVKLLLKCGLISIDKDGEYHRCDIVITTGEDIQSLAVSNFQRKNLELASKAIERFPRSDRDISSLTVSVSKDGAKRVAAELARCRKKLISIVSKDMDVDRVYQINFQSFPLSVPGKDQ